MKISRFTDLGLRVLMYLSRKPIPLVTVAKVAEDLGVSKSHLVKVVNFMAKQQWLLTMKGVYGGIALAKLPQDYLLGEVIRTLEHKYHCDSVRACAAKTNEHDVASALVSVLMQEGLEYLYQNLNQYNLADVVSPKMQAFL